MKLVRAALLTCLLGGIIPGASFGQDFLRRVIINPKIGFSPTPLEGSTFPPFYKVNKATGEWYEWCGEALNGDDIYRQIKPADFKIIPEVPAGLMVHVVIGFFAGAVSAGAIMYFDPDGSISKVAHESRRDPVVSSCGKIGNS